MAVDRACGWSSRRSRRLSACLTDSSTASARPGRAATVSSDSRVGGEGASVFWRCASSSVLAPGLVGGGVDRRVETLELELLDQERVGLGEVGQLLDALRRRTPRPGVGARRRRPAATRTRTGATRMATSFVPTFKFFSIASLEYVDSTRRYTLSNARRAPAPYAESRTHRPDRRFLRCSAQRLLTRVRRIRERFRPPAEHRPNSGRLEQKRGGWAV